MEKADWQGVCDDTKMADCLFWPTPITLSTDPATAESISESSDLALVGEDDKNIGTMTVNEKFV